VRFTVVDGLQVGNITVIAKGAIVTGSVTVRRKKKILGMGGRQQANVPVLQVDGVDGKKVNVRSMSGRRAEGPTIRTFETKQDFESKGPRGGARNRIHRLRWIAIKLVSVASNEGIFGNNAKAR